jgi:hypothetical protein
MTLLPILLPEGFEVKVSAGQKIAAGSVLAEGQGQAHEEIINLAGQLKLSPQKAVKALKKNLGDSVSSGEVLAVKKSLFGSQKIISKFSGIIAKIDEASGDLVIRVSGDEAKKNTIACPIDGIIDSLDKQKIVIKTDKQAFLATDGVGAEKEGELLYIPDFNGNKLNDKVEDKIILAENVDRVAVFKAIGLDASGVITKNLEDIDFIDLENKNIRIPILEVNEEDFQKLIKEIGKKLYLFGKKKSIIVL